MKLHDGQRITIALPTSCTVEVDRVPNEPDIWTVVVKIWAKDVETGECAEFKTKWQGNHPTSAEVVNAIMIMLKHEVFEQLGMKPHGYGVPKDA